MFAIFSYLLSGDECKAVIKTLESKSPAITPSNGQYQTAGMFCQMSRKLHKITDHRTYSSAMYFLPAGSILLFQRFLPYDSKDIICDHCQLQHQFVALKLSRRESFNIHVRLDFTVILLTFSVGMVKINDCFVWQESVCPVCAQFYIGYDKILPISVNGSFRDLKYPLCLKAFHSKKYEYIVQRIWARAILHNFSSEIISNVEIEQRDTQYEYHANFTEAFRICRDFLRIHDGVSTMERKLDCAKHPITMKKLPSMQCRTRLMARCGLKFIDQVICLNPACLKSMTLVLNRYNIFSKIN